MSEVPTLPGIPAGDPLGPHITSGDDLWTLVRMVLRCGLTTEGYQTQKTRQQGVRAGQANTEFFFFFFLLLLLFSNVSLLVRLVKEIEKRTKDLVMQITVFLYPECTFFVCRMQIFKCIIQCFQAEYSFLYFRKKFQYRNSFFNCRVQFQNAEFHFFCNLSQTMSQMFKRITHKVSLLKQILKLLLLFSYTTYTTFGMTLFLLELL